MRFRLFLLFTITLILFTCSTVEKDLLIGSWKIDNVEGVGEKDFENMRDVRFEFFPNGRYSFQSTLNIREAGRYSIDGNLLNTTDTTVANPTEKSVQITKLTPDSLYFFMNNSGKKQNLKFSKIK